MMTKAKLKGWQLDVLDAIVAHEELRGQEQYQGVGTYQTNRDLGISISMPQGAGYTALIKVIAENHPTLIVYADSKHYRANYQDVSWTVSETISMHEIYYALTKPNVHQPCEELAEINDRVLTKKVVVVENANKLPQVVRDYLYNESSGIVIMLG